MSVKFSKPNRAYPRLFHTDNLFDSKFCLKETKTQDINKTNTFILRFLETRS